MSTLSALLLSLIPNTAFLDFTDSALALGMNSPASGAPYTAFTNATWSPIEIINSITLKKTRTSAAPTPGFKWMLSPDFSWDYEQFQFRRASDQNPLAGQEFTWNVLSAGIGPEIGYESAIGYFYGNVIPTVAANWISQSPTNKRSNLQLTLTAEVGWEIFLSQRWILRLYGKGMMGPSQDWETLLSTAANEPIELRYSFLSVYGVAVGFHIPETVHTVERLFSK